ncbi:MAG: CBS domain-containing protein [Thermoplasmata archaeon]|nr:MAG: CBS domain-containing protein [Thermoplasmata archaeon]
MPEKKRVVKKSSSSGATKDARKMRVSDLIITDEFKIIEMDANGKAAAQKLMGIPRGVVLVIDSDGKAKGVITAREFLKKIVDGDNPVSLDVDRLMNKDIMEIKYTALLDSVVPQVTQRDPYAVVVIDDAGKFKGYFSPKDYQEALARINYVQPK